MKTIKLVGLMIVGYLLTMGQALAIAPVSVPEIDGSGAIIGIGMVVGLAALVREKFYRK
jgi:hypothetical protein